MSKIVQAVNSMISNPELISKVVEAGTEIFFLYKNKYKWSMRRRDDSHYLWFYPGNESLETLAAYSELGWEEETPTMVVYHDAKIGTKEARASFAELYTLLKEKLYGIDEVLNDIISDAELL